jgi:hypothetical protein
MTFSGTNPAKSNAFCIFMVQLCKASQEWANVLATRGRLEHRANIDYGENLYCMWSSNPKTIVGGEEPVNEW